MKKRKSTLFEVVALAVAGACTAVYGYILGYVRGKALDDTSIEGQPLEVGEEAFAEHLSDILTEESDEEETISADTQ